MFLKGRRARIEDKVASHFQFQGDLSERALIDGLFQAKIIQPYLSLTCDYLS